MIGSFQVDAFQRDTFDLDTAPGGTSRARKKKRGKAPPTWFEVAYGIKPGDEELLAYPEVITAPPGYEIVPVEEDEDDDILIHALLLQTLNDDQTRNSKSRGSKTRARR